MLVCLSQLFVCFILVLFLFLKSTPTTFDFTVHKLPTKSTLLKKKEEKEVKYLAKCPAVGQIFKM